MGSFTPIKDIPDAELERDLEIAYEDLGYLLARIVAIRCRLEPGESKINLLGWSLGSVNQNFDKIVQQAENM